MNIREPCGDWLTFLGTSLSEAVLDGIHITISIHCQA